MSQAKSIAQNSAALLASNVANRFLGFLIMLSVARLLGTEQFGLYTWVFTYVSVFSLATDLGLTTVVIRGIVAGDDVGRRWLGNALIIRWPVSLVAYSICVGTAALFYGTGSRTQLVAVFALSFLAAPLSTYTAIYSARMKLYGPALVNLGARMILFLIVQWLARHGGTVMQLLAADALATALTNVLIWARSRSMLRPLYIWDRVGAWKMLSESVPLFLTTIFVSLYFRIDVFFLDHYRGGTTLGIYAAAYRLTEALPLIAGALANSIFPILCRHYHESDYAIPNRLVGVSLRLLEAAIVPVAFLVSYYSTEVTQLLYGGRFEGSASLLAILVFGQIAVYANVLLCTLLVARGMGRQLMLLTVGMLFFNVAANFAVIPIYGATGAAATTVATELVGLIGCVLLTSTGSLFAVSVLRLAVPAAVCGIVLAMFRPAAGLSLDVIWPLLAVALIYPPSLYLFGSFSRDEWKRLRQLAWG